MPSLSYYPKSGPPNSRGSSHRAIRRSEIRGEDEHYPIVREILAWSDGNVEFSEFPRFAEIPQESFSSG